MGNTLGLKDFFKYLPRGKSLITFVLTFSLIGFMTYLSYHFTMETIAAGEWITHTHRVLNEIHETAGSVREIESAQRGYLLTGMDEFLHSYDAAIVKARADLSDLPGYMFDNPRQKQRLPRLSRLMEKRIAIAEISVSARRSGDFDAAQKQIKIGAGRAVSQEILTLLDAMEDDENALLSERYDTLAHKSELTFALLAALGAISTALFCLNYYMTNLLIFERRRSEDETRRYAGELEAAKLRLDAILASMAEGLYQIDDEGRIVFINPAGEKILGYSAAELMGRNIDSVIHRAQPEVIENDSSPVSDDRYKTLSLRRVTTAKEITAGMPRVGQTGGYPVAAAVNGAGINGEDDDHSLAEEEYIAPQLIDIIKAGVRYESTDELFVRKDGSVLPVHYVSSPLEHDGIVTGAVLTFRDVTQRKEAERRVSEFYSTVSHELRSPLTSIRGALGLMEGGKAGEFSPKAARLIRIAKEECERLIRLINDILDIRKIEAGKLQLFLKDESVAEIVKATVDGIRAMADEAHVSLSVMPIDPSLKMLCDRDRMVQVLTNLIGNAVKFSPAGEAVTVSAEPVAAANGGSMPSENPRIRLAIKDTGPGISDAEREKLFHVFQQLDSSDSRPKGGTGLGLAISKALVEQHGGTIGLDSKVGAGSTFWFEVGGGTMKKDLKEAIAKLAVRFASELPERIDQIAAAIKRFEEEPVNAGVGLKAARDNVHQLAGTAGSYGLAEVGNIMASIEKKLEALMEASDQRVVAELKSDLKADLEQTRSLIASL
ncbi:MAG: CHASE3 domain-containing protein [Cyanobacteria bacterium REEB67]|nr:CHASE3 domain-containing protein [Cyanobacteria bacterium REEB67]